MAKQISRRYDCGGWNNPACPCTYLYQKGGGEKTRQALPDDAYTPVMVNLPVQQWQSDLYDAQTALHSGTLFPALNKPFLMAGGNRYDR